MREIVLKLWGRQNTWTPLAKICPVGMAVLLLAVPSVMAGPVQPATVRTAPYHLISFTPLDSVVTNGSCARATILVPSQFHPRTGLGGFSLSAAARSCGSQDLGSAEGDFVAVLAVGRPPASSAMITVNFSVNATMSVAFNPGICSASASRVWWCYEDAVYTFGFYWELIDLSLNGSYVGQPYPPVFAPVVNGSSVTVDCLSTGCVNQSTNNSGASSINFVGSSPLSVGHLNTTHRYAIEFFADATAGVSFSGAVSRASGSVQVNLMAPGLDLRWISVT